MLADFTLPTTPLMDELSAWLILIRAPGLQAGTLRDLLDVFGDAPSIVRASRGALHAAGASSAFVDWLASRHDEELRTDLRWLERDGHHLVRCTDEWYPALLHRLIDAPAGLLVRGDPGVLTLPQLAIVGSRSPTSYGREIAADFAARLVRSGLAVTSGFAVGIDAASHRGALAASGVTIAVCGTGLDVDYPSTHAELAAEIAERGALVSELPLGTPSLKHNFPRRNRIISGLSVGTLVVEAAVHSGSLITARLAAEQGREVFAIPGSIRSERTRGCHRLIREGAKLVENVDDILCELAPLIGTLATAAGREIARAEAPEASGFSGTVLDKGYEILLDALGFEPASVDVLVARTGLRADEVASMLLMLELERRVDTHPGGLYVRRA
jgi:DNA processing protein